MTVENELERIAGALIRIADALEKAGEDSIEVRMAPDSVADAARDLRTYVEESKGNRGPF